MSDLLLNDEQRAALVEAATEFCRRRFRDPVMMELLDLGLVTARPLGADKHHRVFDITLAGIAYLPEGAE